MTDEELWTVYKQAAINGLCTQDHKTNEQIIATSESIATASVESHRERWPDGEKAE